MRLHGIDRLIAGLALLLIGLLTARQLQEPAAPPLTSVDPDQVQEIRVFEKGKLRLAFLRDAQGWLLSHPKIVRARAPRVANLLALLEAPSRAHWPASATLRQQAGLDTPAREVDFGKLRIAFGGTSIPAGQRYVLVGDQVHLIDAFWFDLAGLPASHFEAQ